MKLNRLVVLTEGGKNLGFGHIMRCLTIAKSFKESGVEVEFIIDGDDSIQSVLNDQKFCIMDWINNKFLLERLEEFNFILIDSIRVSNHLIRNIQMLRAKLLFIDDDKRRNILDTGFVLDWTVLAEYKNYFSPRKKGVTYLLGSKYAPIRNSFRLNQKNKISKKIKSIFVSFGGSDVRNLTPKVLLVLSQNFPDLKKTIVIGAGFKNIKRIKSYQDENTTLIFNAGAEKMSKLMNQSDVAISCGGQTLYELACIGLPAIIILMGENARYDTEGWAEVGTIDFIGNYNEKNLMNKLVHSLKSLHAQKIRKEMHLAGRNFIGEDGCKLIMSSVLKC